MQMVSFPMGRGRDISHIDYVRQSSLDRVALLQADHTADSSRQCHLTRHTQHTERDIKKISLPNKSITKQASTQHTAGAINPLETSLPAHPSIRQPWPICGSALSWSSTHDATALWTLSEAA